MKKSIFILLIVISASLVNCESDDNETNIPEATLIGRWSLVGFEDNILYEFTENKRYNIYAVDGKFLTLEEIFAESPNFPGLDWYYEGEKVVVDLNFGNESASKPNFKCSNNVIEFTNDEDIVVQILFREGFDYSSCKE